MEDVHVSPLHFWDLRLLWWCLKIVIFLGVTFSCLVDMNWHFQRNLLLPSSGYLSTPKMEGIATHLPDNRVTCCSKQLSFWLHEACTAETCSRMLITDSVRAPPIMGHLSGPALSATWERALCSRMMPSVSLPGCLCWSCVWSFEMLESNCIFHVAVWFAVQKQASISVPQVLFGQIHHLVHDLIIHGQCYWLWCTHMSTSVCIESDIWMCHLHCHYSTTLGFLINLHHVFLLSFISSKSSFISSWEC